MPPDEKQVLRIYLFALFATWSLYVTFFYHSVEALPQPGRFLLHEAVRFIVFAGIPVWWAFRKAEHPIAALGLKCSWRSLVIGFAVGLLYASLGVLVGVYVQHRHFHPRIAEWAYWSAGFNLATLVEELGFRSFFLGVLHFRNSSAAILASAVCFALIHTPGWYFLHLVASGAELATQLASIFLLGCVLALVFRKTRSLYAVILVHALNNLAAAALRQ